MAETGTNPAPCLVTPSYGPDLARCALLVRSVEAMMPGTRHYLIIDRHELGAFAHLASSTVQIIESESLLPTRFRRMPFGPPIWFSFGGALTRGWIVQQMLKIAAATQLGEDVTVYCDSDVVFTRPFSLNHLFIGDRLPLLDLDLNMGKNAEWTATACRLLGYAEARCTVRGHIGNLIPWRASVARQMTDAIEAATGRRWDRAIAAQRTFSEYVLYGCFVRNFVGYDAAGHVPSDSSVVGYSWGKDIARSDVLAAVFDGMKPHEVGVMLHSKSRPDLTLVQQFAEKAWARTAST